MAFECDSKLPSSLYHVTIAREVKMYVKSLESRLGLEKDATKPINPVILFLCQGKRKIHSHGLSI